MKDQIVMGKTTKYILDNREVSEKEYRKRYPLPSMEGSGTMDCALSCTAWPMISDACAVHPKQVAQAQARSDRMGLGVEYLPNGQARIPDRAARRRLLRAEGFHDNRGGYGDG